MQTVGIIQDEPRYLAFSSQLYFMAEMAHRPMLKARLMPKRIYVVKRFFDAGRERKPRTVMMRRERPACHR